MNMNNTTAAQSAFGGKPAERRMMNYNMWGICAALVAWLILRSVLSGLVVSGASIALSLSGQRVSAPIAQIIYAFDELVTTVVSMGLPFFVMTKLMSIPFSVVLPFRRVRHGFTLWSLFIALGASTLGIFCGTLISGALGMLGFSSKGSSSLPIDVTGWVLYVIVYVILPAILEEMVFRGVIMQPLRRFGDDFAVIISAVLFAMAHFSLQQFPTSLILGLIIGYYVVRTGSLRPAIIIHLVNNGVAIIAELFVSLVDQQTSYLIFYGLYTLYLVLGMASFVLVSKNSSKLFMLYPYQGTMASNERYKHCFGSVPMIILMIIVVITTARAMF